VGNPSQSSSLSKYNLNFKVTQTPSPEKKVLQLLKIDADDKESSSRMYFQSTRKYGLFQLLEVDVEIRFKRKRKPNENSNNYCNAD
jgi:hypothetical protein